MIGCGPDCQHYLFAVVTSLVGRLKGSCGLFLTFHRPIAGMTFCKHYQQLPKHTILAFRWLLTGINESTHNGTFSGVWKLGLKGLVQEIAQTKNIVLITTCRTSYEKAIWGDKDFVQ